MRYQTERREASSWNECIRDETTFAVCSPTINKKLGHSLAFPHFACDLIAHLAAGLFG
ncbi:MAG TPA: hypothetical protein VFA09_13895 [Ktedonobacteraceae bacterium]|jgi:hypothetical protein|nr:hypothetical protein [Ktedonobacteraceae bacterium]